MKAKHMQSEEKTKYINGKGGIEKPPAIQYSGQKLREIRERLGVTLREIAHATKIQPMILQNIEIERYDSLPPDIYTKSFVSSYAKCLSLDSQKVAADYMNRYYAWKSDPGFRI